MWGGFAEGRGWWPGPGRSGDGESTWMWAASGSSGGTLPVGSVCGGGKEREASRVVAESDLGYPKVVEAK